MDCVVVFKSNSPLLWLPINHLHLMFCTFHLTEVEIKGILERQQSDTELEKEMEGKETKEKAKESKNVEISIQVPGRRKGKSERCTSVGHLLFFFSFFHLSFFLSISVPFCLSVCLSVCLFFLSFFLFSFLNSWPPGEALVASHLGQLLLKSLSTGLFFHSTRRGSRILTNCN